MTPERKEITPPIVLVGEQNSRDGADPRFDLYPLPENSAGGRLCRLILGVSRLQYMRYFYRRNLLRTGTWRRGAAIDAANRLIADLPGARIVMLGAKVSAAFGMGGLLDFEARTFTESGRHLLRLPHTSGRCRTWNEPGAYERAREALRRFLPPEIAALVGSAVAQNGRAAMQGARRTRP